MRQVFAFIISACMLAFSPVHAQTPQSSIHEYTLENGLKLIVKPDHRAPVVVAQVWYKVGSGNEPGGITGISHVLEHLMFEGTKQYPAGTFSRIIAANGGQENAFTSTDFTAYFQKLAAKRLALSFKLEADRMHNLVLAPTRFNKELEVVKEERRMRVDDNPTALTMERMLAAAHISNPYHHLTIGWMNDLENLKLNDLKRWYQTWYVPNNAIVVVVGDVDPKQVFTLAQQTYGKVPKGPSTSLKPQKEPPPMGVRKVNVKAPAKLPVLIMAYNVPSLNTTDNKSDAYALEVLAAILDGGESARLEKNIVRGNHLASSVDVDYDLYSRFSGLFTIDGVPSQEHTSKQLQQAFQDEINKIKTKLITTEEIERVKAQVIASKVYSQDSLMGQAMEIGSLESVGLSWREIDNYVKQIQAITPEQVKAVAQKYLVDDRLTIATLDPQPINKSTRAVRQTTPGVSHVR